MRQLNLNEMQHVGGAGIACATLALPVSIVVGAGTGVMGFTSGFIGSILQGKGIVDTATSSLSTACLGAKVGVLLEQGAYNMNEVGAISKFIFG